MNKIARFAAVCGLSAAAVTANAATFTGERTDFRDETIYFAMTTRFYDGDPTNNVCSWDKQDVQISKNDPDWRGDFKGLIDRLDYIKALGFTAVWITPIVQNASGEDYHGYHAMDLSSVDLRYESRKAWGADKDVKFQDLIDAAHAKGMKIILDIVLQHTGNFGESYLNPLFTRDQNIRNQASPAACLIPNPDRLSSNYFDQSPKLQYEERFKFFKNPQYDTHNYYHHYGTGWNWDLPNRWWGQIAGDCVDLNTENNTVAEYVVKCYSKFIEMGVDGFRIDTSGHIAPLTFNKQFIPQFHAAAEKAKNKRLNGCPFFMFGEVCQRFQGSVVYRAQPNLSSYFYTWKSDDALMSEYNGTQAFWDTQTLPEGHDTPVGPMALCEKDTKDKARSNNAWLQNGQWHEPDYSQASGFNVIDFPVHYSFSSVGHVMGLFSQDNYYNDATYNVVYVDSHDYSPGPNDGIRFNGGTAQWAENLSFMFTFRGIPCIYYGSEVEFKKGLPIDVGGGDNKTPRSQSGRAYFGNYLEGSVSASDFGVYTASGNVAQTLDADLAQHIRRLNMIRAAVPALRKGQYTFDGCNANGGWAFKRAYKDESYALVAVNGGASFTGVPAGTYVDVVTGRSYTPNNGSITVDAPKTQGQLRVLVKDWKGGKVGEDGKFMYATSAVAHGGSVEFDDPGTTQYYTSEDVVKPASVVLSPDGGAFKTETLTVTATLSDEAVSGWYKIDGGAQVALTKGQPKTFTVGTGLDFGQSTTVEWSATGSDNNVRTGKATYKKVDPNATITVYVTAPSAPNMYAWTEGQTDLIGKWPGKKLTDTKEIDGRTFYYNTFDGVESVNIIFSNGGAKTGDIEGITEDTYFEYDGNTTAKKIDVQVSQDASVRFSPNGGNFYDVITVTATAKNATSAWYKIGNGAQVNISGSASFKIGEGMNIGDNVTVSWSATGATGTKTGSVTFSKIAKPVEPEGITVFYDNSITNWGTVKVHFWGGESASDWPGKAMAKVADATRAALFKYVVPTGTTGLVFNNGGSDQTDDITDVRNNAVYKGTGNRGFEIDGTYTGIANIEAEEEAPAEFYNLQGIRVENPGTGMYIMRQGKTVRKVYIR